MPARLGIVGGGQLGRMLALAAAPLGIECRFVDPSTEAGAQVAANQIVADYDNVDALIELAEWSDVVTFEFENVPAPALEVIAGRATLAPPQGALEVSQDRLAEKQLFESLGLPVAPYRAVNSQDELEAALAEIGTPAILKTRRLGYDGKGQVRIASADEAGHAWKSVESEPSVLEGFVDFERELSVVVVRAQDGTSISYPLAENGHEKGILLVSSAPAGDVDDALQEAAVSRATAIADELNHVGALALELFDVGGHLLANEFAPRVHNTGHWTIEGAATSQFENHLRAILGLPLGSTSTQPSLLVNLIGSVPRTEDVLAIPGAHLHLYGKQPRRGRKLGHITLVEPTRERERALEDLINEPSGRASLSEP
jgi:5-(carboxyamino)imidazole ribonucleotide synthase